MKLKYKNKWWVYIVICIFAGGTFLLIFLNSPQKSLPINLTEEQTTKIENYINFQKDIGDAGFGGKLFTTVKVLGINNVSGTIIKVYVYDATQEYYLEKKSLKEGCGVGIPVSVTVDTANGDFKITGHKIPRDSPDYGKDIKAIFPLYVQNLILNSHTDDGINNLYLQNKSKAKVFYKIQV